MIIDDIGGDIMNKVKIISNPYKKENLFQFFNEEEYRWENINYENNPNSKLLSDSFHKGFFPFVVADIVEEIINEYSVYGEKTKLYFEGTDDDFNELMQVCSHLSENQNIVLSRENIYLDNANKVLNEIKKVFKELKPIITNTESNKEEIESHLNKFLDITNDIVPLCVMGNYSAGKSTFINALIGSEILPSGDEPLTAKIFKIVQADHEGFACIKLRQDSDFMIVFNEMGYEFVGDDKASDLVELLRETLDKAQNESMTLRINKALSIINQYHETDASRLIEITLPFKNGLWEQTNTRFIILDTPGSNSASNNEHLKVLESALSGLTNGLAIYVSEYDSLDSKDNKELYEKIKNIKELDNRFTLIVVNKADENDLPIEGFYSKEKEDEILNYTIPKNLYTEGIFFVSSILGLGSKTDGKFINKHLNKIYRKTKFLFNDQEDEDYTVLYRYNIMPQQLKEKIIVQAQNSSEDLVYVNSGLYSVEQEIQNFANNYASYNKCKQSTICLDNIMDIISNEINDIIKNREETRESLKNALEKDKRDLINQIHKTSDEDYEQFIQKYNEFMNQFVEDNQVSFEYEDIKVLEEQYTEQQKTLLNFEDKDEEVKDSFDSLKNNFMEGMNGILKSPNLDSLIKVGKTLLDDVKDTYDDIEKLQSTKREADRKTAKLILDKVKEDYLILSNESQIKIDATSKDYWAEQSLFIKQQLSKIITGSTALSDDKRSELSEIIMTYHDICFDQFKDISFELKDFVHGIKIGDFIIFESDKLNLRKLVNSYNKLFEMLIEEAKSVVHESHIKTFNDWLEHLLSIIEKNIVSYSPELSEMQQDIEMESRKIDDLRNKQEMIQKGKNHINNMMNWKLKEE